MSKFVKCINSFRQPRLQAGAIYEVVLDVSTSNRPGRSGNSSGYIVKLDGDEVAIPYVYDRDRFESVAE